MKIIEWDNEGYPTEESLEQLEKILAPIVLDQDRATAKDAFYAALKENCYKHACGPARVEVRGETIDVWEYHTMGWSGNESIIRVLSGTWLWGFCLERFDAGGHYYFRPELEVE